MDDNLPHYNETLMFEVSGVTDYSSFYNNLYFNTNALNLDEAKQYKGEEGSNDTGEKYTYEFVYDKEADALIDEDNSMYIYNHKSYNGTDFIEDTNSAVLTFAIKPMGVGEEEVNGYFRLYEIDKVELDSNCLSDDVNIKNSLTVGTRIGDIGIYSVAEGDSVTASAPCSHAEGCYTKAIGYGSHAEGDSAEASGRASHAEGNNTTASGRASHAEGNSVEASGVSSHAEGMMTISSGGVSHAEGRGTIASSDYQHVQGKYNVADTSNKYAHIVGNGTADNARSNAHTLDWNGNAWYQGKITIGADNKELATQEYVDLVGFTLAKGTEDSPIVLNSLTTGVIYKVVGYYKNIDTSEILSLSKPMYINIFSRNSTSFSYVKFNSTGTNPCGIYVVKLTDGTYTYNSLVRQTQVLTKTNTEEYTPTSDYHPSTKKYVDDNKVTKTSELTNDSNFVDETYVTNAINNAQLGGSETEVDLTIYQTKTDSTLNTTDKTIVGSINEIKGAVDTIEIPTKTSDLTNDSGFITSIPSEYVTETELEAKGYSTFSGSYNDLTNKPTIPSAYTHPNTHPASMITGLSTVATSGSYNDLSNKPTSLPANGGNAETVDGFHIWQGTQAQFNAITSKDANTIYLIKEG